MISLGVIPNWGHGYIFQKEDEWFYVFCVVHSSSSHRDIIFGWKCDQIEGLINCVKFLMDK